MSSLPVIHCAWSVGRGNTVLRLRIRQFVEVQGGEAIAPGELR